MDKLNLIGVIVIIPLMFGAFCLVGASSLDQRHTALKTFLFLLSIVCIWASLHLGILGLIEFYPSFTALQDAIGNLTYWNGIMFGVITTYFIIDLFVGITHTAAQRKKERQNY